MLRPTSSCLHTDVKEILWCGCVLSHVTGEETTIHHSMPGMSTSVPRGVVRGGSIPSTVTSVVFLAEFGSLDEGSLLNSSWFVFNAGRFTRESHCSVIASGSFITLRTFPTNTTLCNRLALLLSEHQWLLPNLKAPAITRQEAMVFSGWVPLSCASYLLSGRTRPRVQEEKAAFPVRTTDGVQSQRTAWS